MKKAAILVALSAVSMTVYADDLTNTTQPQTTGTAMQSTSPETNNKINGQAFLAENAKKPGVVTLPDGLQYKVITKGTGTKPTASDVVTVNYAGTLVNGKEFDSSYTRGEPATFPVNGVIAGWTEALQMMPKGSTWMLYIPSSLAYGEQGMPPVIGPNETLIFKVELLDVKKG
jgi:FKBP-type peptidyl-prolyl cis-trans isomerase FklB